MTIQMTCDSLTQSRRFDVLVGARVAVYVAIRSSIGLAG